MKRLLMLTLFSIVLTGCSVSFGDGTQRAQIYADAAVQRAQEQRQAEEAKAREQRLAEEARAQAQVNTEYARQDGKSERAQTWIVITVVLVAGVLGLVWLKEQGRTRREYARLGYHQLPAYSGAFPAQRDPNLLLSGPAPNIQQPVIIVVSDERRDLRTYARSIGGKLAIDDQGYKVYLPDGQMQRLLPMQEGDG